GGISRWRFADSRGRTVTLIEPAGTTAFTYGPFDTVKTITAADTTVTTYVRDAFGRVVDEYAPDTGHTHTDYDGYGEPMTTTDANGRSTKLIYDGDGRVTKRTDNDGVTVSTWDTAVHGVGQLATVVTAPTVPNTRASTRTYTYTAAGKLAYDTLTLDGVNYPIGYAYDAYGRLGTIRYPLTPGIPDLFIVTRNYDIHGHLVRLVDNTNAPIWTLNLADGAKRPTSELFGTLDVTTRTYDDPKSRLKTVLTTHGGATVQNLTYTWDTRRNLQSRYDALQPATESFQYDTSDRVKCAGLTAAPCAVSIHYDSVGNITSKTGVGTYTYDSANPHAVTHAGPSSFSYDLHGNQITRGTTGLQYTARDMPRFITPLMMVPTAYDYDGLGERIQRRAPSETSIYVNDLYERYIPATGTPLSYYSVRNNDGVVAVYTRGVGATHPTNYVHPDHLGSPDVISGLSVAHRSFDVFGAERAPVWGGTWSGTSSGLPLAYTGQHDDILGLVDMKGRMYDPMIGRFLEADMGTPDVTTGQTWSRYSYVRNNPLALVDPTGEDDEPVGDDNSQVSESNVLARENYSSGQTIDPMQDFEIANDPDYGKSATPHDMASTGTTSYVEKDSRLYHSMKVVWNYMAIPALAPFYPVSDTHEVRVYNPGDGNEGTSNDGRLDVHGDENTDMMMMLLSLWIPEGMAAEGAGGAVRE
ncbi:MAG: RHS repeat-associated core domain-containing protein, partial [Kofleriaceae bacterium]